MAQFKTITSVKDAGIDGIEFIKTDKAITEIVIGKVRVRASESYNRSLTVVVEQPFEEAVRYRMTATIEGFDPKVSYHEQRYEADCAANDLVAKGAEATVQEVTALVDEDGAVVGLKGTDAPAEAPAYEPAF